MSRTGYQLRTGEMVPLVCPEPFEPIRRQLCVPHGAGCCDGRAMSAGPAYSALVRQRKAACVLQNVRVDRSRHAGALPDALNERMNAFGRFQIRCAKAAKPVRVCSFWMQLTSAV